ncbi:hypothetical protein [Salimicrobium humidisoli]|nr:hypothetical protein [Salimicrobium humidisoli]
MKTPIRSNAMIVIAKSTVNPPIALRKSISDFSVDKALSGRPDLELGNTEGKYPLGRSGAFYCADKRLTNKITALL